MQAIVVWKVHQEHEAGHMFLITVHLCTRSRERERGRERNRDKDRDKKKSHSMKPENWSKSPISSDPTASVTNNPILSADRPSRLSPDFMIGEEDDDLMDVALIGN